MTIGSMLIVLACLVYPSAPLKVVGLLLAGGGSAVLYLMWADLFGRIGPASVTICFAVAVLGGEVLKFLFMGLAPGYLAVCAVVLPCLAVGCVRSSMFKLPLDKRARNAGRPALGGYPWKPVGLISLCFFVAAFDGNNLRPLNVGNALGAVFASLLILAVVSSRSKHFRVESMNQVLFPLFIIGFILFLPADSISTEVASFRFETAYTMFFMLVLIVLSSVSYRCGIDAVWLNGIERAVRACVEAIGWGLSALLMAHAGFASGPLIHMTFEVVLIAALIVLFFTDKGLSAKWDVRFAQEGDAWDLPDSRVKMRVDEMTQAYGLSPREAEVLEAYVSGRSIADIADALIVAPGTVKAHINHIYHKLGVRSKAELTATLSDPKR